MVKFRFQDLKIWLLAIQIANELFDIADELEKKKLYRFAEQGAIRINRTEFIFTDLSILEEQTRG